MITPYVKIDVDKMHRNIQEMMKGLKNSGISLRPHVKPHKSIELAKMQLQEGAVGITCATLTELEIMARAGVDDILLAIPLIGEDQWEKLRGILSKYQFKFTTVVDSDVGLNGLNKVGEQLKQKMNVLVDIDSGGHREGVQPQQVLPFVDQVLKMDWLNFGGLFTYYGHIYQYDHSLHKEKAKEEANILISFKEKLEKKGIPVKVLSGGSTVSSVNPEQLTGITESRAGNFIFYDMNAVHSKIVEPERCALTVIAKVISKPLEGKATIDAGSKALTSDQPLKGNLYGYVANNPKLKIVKLNEEHGFLEYDYKTVNVNVGDVLEIIPNHACVISNLYNQVFLFEKGKMIKPLDVNARGRNY